MSGRHNRLMAETTTCAHACTHAHTYAHGKRSEAASQMRASGAGGAEAEAPCVRGGRGPARTRGQVFTRTILHEVKPSRSAVA